VRVLRASFEGSEDPPGKKEIMRERSEPENTRESVVVEDSTRRPLADDGSEITGIQNSCDRRNFPEFEMSEVS